MSANPLILAVDDDPKARTVLVDSLERRFGTDYDVVGSATADDALRRLAARGDADRDVALILAFQWMAEQTGTTFLARTRALQPTARRLLMTNWADFTALQDVARASTLGDIDHYAPRPWSATDEQFLAAVSTVLAAWAREHDRYVHAVTIVGEEMDPEVHALRDTLERWGAPVGFLDARSPEGRHRVSELGIGNRLPAVIGPDGRVLPPSLWELAHAYGANDSLPSEAFDAIVLGSGPAGLSAAVYGASEGLRMLIVEPSSLGGQASSSPLIRNYLGFPGGIDGSELLTRAWEQAWRFGVRPVIGRGARTIRAIEGGDLRVTLDDGSQARSRHVIVATGLAYRRIGIASVEALAGRGVFYGSGATEAQALAGEPVAVIGGANSAAEAAVHLARYARVVRLLVRGPSLSGSASEYLIEELSALPNVEVLLNTEVVQAHDAHRLQQLTIHNRVTGDEADLDATGLFILIGAAPRTEWLPRAIARDDRGFVLTGHDVPHIPARDGLAAPRTRPFETAMSGVFAVGDVRHGSTKRIATAVGEGAAAIRAIVETGGSQEPSIPATGPSPRALAAAAAPSH